VSAERARRKQRVLEREFMKRKGPGVEGKNRRKREDNIEEEKLSNNPWECSTKWNIFKKLFLKGK
jgi:hypothetical protein